MLERFANLGIDEIFVFPEVNDYFVESFHVHLTGLNCLNELVAILGSDANKDKNFLILLEDGKGVKRYAMANSSKVMDLMPT